MGQSVHLLLFHESEASGFEAAQAALAELRRVEARLSLFDAASDLVELNRLAGRRAMRAGGDLLAVLLAAERFRVGSGGAFNVAVEPLMRVWGFHGSRHREPDAKELTEARAAVQAAEVLIAGDRVTLPAGHTRLDLGGIAVGYGLDRAAAVLRAHGVGRALLDMSGDILAIGAPPGRPGWEVEVADPRNPGGSVDAVHLRDRALATSANTVSVVRVGGVLRGHVMNPASGYPADRLLQATVVASSGIAADALSTGMLVAGGVLPGVKRSWVIGHGL
jgi:thiamine biosynthesis lipoprotein